MREILFRGKRKDNGEWASATSIFKAEYLDGLRFYINSLSLASVYFNSDGNITRTETELDCEWLEVIQETVGQFTGMTDKNGKKIFEGDIVWCNRTMCDEKAMVGYIVYDECCFCVKDRASANQPAMDLCDDFEVIGNIHDNPEWLEEGDS